MSVPYMFATPMWGWLVDKYIQPEIVNPIGHLTIAASLLLIGKYINKRKEGTRAICNSPMG